MATHRISFPHVTRSSASSAEQLGRHPAQVKQAAEPNFALFMMAPVIIALTTLAIIWMSKVSF
jgi:hypothetical protein